jgi:hypothetical protein
MLIEGVLTGPYLCPFLVPHDCLLVYPKISPWVLVSTGSVEKLLISLLVDLIVCSILLVVTTSFLVG